MGYPGSIRLVINPGRRPWIFINYLGVGRTYHFHSAADILRKPNLRVSAKECERFITVKPVLQTFQVYGSAIKSLLPQHRHHFGKSPYSVVTLLRIYQKACKKRSEKRFVRPVIDHKSR